MKEGIRIIGIDDSPFSKSCGESRSRRGGRRKVLVVGIVQRDGIVEGVLSTHLTMDGTDATSKLIDMVSNSRFAQQIRLVLLHGTMMAGLNVVDIVKLSQRLKVPIIAVTRRKPEMERVYNALRKSDKRTFETKKKIIAKTAGFTKVRLGGDVFFIQPAGIDAKKAEELLRRFGVGSLRLAHIVGSGIVKGESSGRL